MSDDAYITDLSKIKTLAGASLMTKREDDGVAVMIPFLEEIRAQQEFYGVAVEISPVAARRFAAELLNVADEIDD